VRLNNYTKKMNQNNFLCNRLCLIVADNNTIRAYLTDGMGGGGAEAGEKMRNVP